MGVTNKPSEDGKKMEDALLKEYEIFMKSRDEHVRLYYGVPAIVVGLISVFVSFILAVRGYSVQVQTLELLPALIAGGAIVLMLWLNIVKEIHSIEKQLQKIELLMRAQKGDNAFDYFSTCKPLAEIPRRWRLGIALAFVICSIPLVLPISLEVRLAFAVVFFLVVIASAYFDTKRINTASKASYLNKIVGNNLDNENKGHS